MAKKSEKKGTRSLATGQPVKPASTGYLGEAAELESQQARLRRAAAAGAEALKSPPMPAAQPAALEAPVPAKPSASAGSQWPEGGAAKVEVKPASPAPAAKPPPASSPVKAGQVGERPVSTGPKKVNVTFLLLEPSAKEVYLRGDFNGWSADAMPMKRKDDGHWEATIGLAPGRYEYKFFVNGEWVPDPQAREQVWNRHGTLNSVIQVQG